MEPTQILVVDYHEPDLEILIRQTFRKRIQANELEFLFAHNAANAITLLNKNREIDIVLADVKMQLEDGIDFLFSLSQMKRLLKMIVITPYGDIESIRTAMNRGAFDFVTRPINLQELELTIMKTIDQLKKIRDVEKVQNKLIDIEKELDIAKSIQNSILPHDFKPLSQFQSFEVFGAMLAAKYVGGDFYDFFPVDEQHLAFTIADVSGKGVPAALFMTMTRGLIRAIGQKTRSPLHCFKQLNELITLDNEFSMFVTAFYGIFDAKTGKVEYCNAGHNPPYLIDEKGMLTQIGRCEGIALGVTKDDSFFVQKSIQLNTNDIFLLYTDGVTEAMNSKGELFQEKRFEDILERYHHLPLRLLLDKILEGVKEFSGEREQSDDITLFGIRRLKT
jgi:phosphoserine phosphatase RsbU/P